MEPIDIEQAWDYILSWSWTGKKQLTKQGISRPYMYLMGYYIYVLYLDSLPSFIGIFLQIV